MNDWNKYPADLPQDVQTVKTIIEDGLSNGFEFKVENHTLYFREITPAI